MTGRGGQVNGATARRQNQQKGQLGGLLGYLGRGCILLLLAERPSHGYSLLEPLGALGFSSVDRGGVYRTLNALEREGLVTSTLAASNLGPDRRIYEVTEGGQRTLETWASSLQEMKWTIRSCLKRYEGLFEEGEEEAPAAGELS